MHFNTVDFASSKLKVPRILFFISGLTIDPVKNNNEITMGGLKNHLARSKNVLETISLEAKSTVLAINSIYAQVRAPEWVKRWRLSSILLGVVYLNSSLPLGKDLRYLCFPLREKYYLEMHKKSIYAKYGALNASFDG